MGPSPCSRPLSAAGVKKVVYASSASVYGAADVFPTDERHHPYNNRTLYGAAKLMDEGIARHFHDMNGLPSVGLRYFNVYGPRMDSPAPTPRSSSAGSTASTAGVAAPDPRRRLGHMDFVYVTDVARANLLAMESDRVDDVYNVASGTETSLLELWQAIQQVTGGAPTWRPSSTRRGRSTPCPGGWPKSAGPDGARLHRRGVRCREGLRRLARGGGSQGSGRVGC